MADPLSLPSFPKPDNRPRLLSGPTGPATRDELENLFRAMPKSLQTRTFYCILFLPWAFRAEFGAGSLAERFNRRYLFGETRNFPEVRLPDGGVLVFVDIDSIRRERLFRDLETRVLPHIGIRLRAMGQMSFRDPLEDTEGNGRAIRALYEQARAAVKEPAPSSFSFTLPRQVVARQITSADMELLRAEMGYLGKVAHSTLGNQFVSLATQLADLGSGADFQLIRDYVAALGSNSLDIFTEGRVDRLNANEFRITLTRVLHFFSDAYEFDEGSKFQPLGWWDPDRGFAPGRMPVLMNRDFQNFQEQFVGPFNQLAGRRVLHCQPFRVRCNPAIQHVSGAEFSVVCKF